MNIENAKTLVGQLKRLPDEKFWMPNFIIHSEDIEFYPTIPRKHRDCGTIGCIAGWAQMLNGPRARLFPSEWARRWLGLSNYEAERLFMGAFSRKRRMDKITRVEAIAELERMIEAEHVSA